MRVRRFGVAAIIPNAEARERFRRALGTICCGFSENRPMTDTMTDIMKQFFVVILMIFAVFRSIYAALGDNEDKVNESYGKRVERRPRQDGTVSNLYEKGDYLYLVIFLKGVSVFEMCSRADGLDLSPKEIATFLNANAAGATWAPDNKKEERRFERSDHHAEATYVNIAGRPTLTVRQPHTKR